MAAVALPINLPQQPASTNASGDPAVDLTQPGSIKGIDLFAALLAKQVGLDLKGTAGLETKIGADAPAATDPSAVVVDPALQAQQAALFLPVAVNIPNELKPVADPVSVPNERTEPAAISLVDLASSGAKAETSRQAVAAAPAAFATELESAAVAADKAAAFTDTNFSLKLAQAEVLQSAGTTDSPPPPISLPVQAPQPQNNAVQASSNIPQPVGHSAWGDMLGDRVVWMVSQQHQGVELHLNPPALGPLDVRVSMNDGQANLSFATQHLPVKEAIESATAQLREMLGESGISLGSVSVNLGSFAQQQQQQNSSQPQTGTGSPSWADLAPVSELSANRSALTSLLNRNGMVDIFA